MDSLFFRATRRWLRPGSLAALAISFALLRGSHSAARGSMPRSWTLANAAVVLTITRDAQGRLRMTQLRDRRTGYDWCPAAAPSPIFQVAFRHTGEPCTLTEESRFVLLAQRLTRAPDGTEVLRLRVRARRHPVELTLYWRLRPGLAPVEKWYTLTNRAQQPITVSRLDTFSQQVAAPERPRLWYVHKGTAIPGTLRVYEEPLADDQPETLSSSPGERGDFVDSVPWFLLERGRGRGGLLFAWAFSGDGGFQVTSGLGSTRITGGLAAGHFQAELFPGHTLLSPLGLFGPYAGSPDDGANAWHRFLVRHWSPAADPLAPRVDYNTWCSLGLAVNEASCRRQLRAAAALGAELFHLDAGWYRAPGDWHPDPKRFPHGLRPLVQEAHRLGMRFGLWVAFAQISEAMLRRHPDWVTTPGKPIDPNRPLSFRTRTICLGNPAARAWIQRELTRIVAEYGVDLLEYDQPIIEECAVRSHDHGAGDGSYAATLGFYQLYDTLHQRFPHLLLENCMDGGHIMDFGVLRRTSFTSITDFTDPVHNRIALYGASYPWPAAACETYMRDARSLPPEYLFRSFMMGRWTISADVAGWDPNTRAIARRQIALYKQLRPLIRDGDVYHILPQATGKQWDGLEYYDPARGEGVAFVFRPQSPEAVRRIPLAGLAPGAYEVRVEGQAGSTRAAGADLEREGLAVSLPEPDSAAIVRFRRLHPAAPAASRA